MTNKKGLRGSVVRRYRFIYDNVLKDLDLKGKRVLDIACGTAMGAKFIAQETGAIVTAADRDIGGVESEDGIILVQADIRKYLSTATASILLFALKPLSI